MLHDLGGEVITALPAEPPAVYFAVPNVMVLLATADLVDQPLYIASKFAAENVAGVFPAMKFKKLVHKEIFHAPRFWSNAVAPLNMPFTDIMLLMFQPPMFWLKATAPANVLAQLFARGKTHPEISLLNDMAFWNIESKN